VYDIATERINSYILFFFEKNIAGHFNEEEKNLFSKLPANDNLCKRAFEEHDALYLLIKKIKTDVSDRSLVLEFAGLLEKHIRFEERILFNYLQELLPEDEFEKLALEHGRSDRETDDSWNDTFWVIK
jgi:hemerythrin-like domain-containing protein